MMMLMVMMLVIEMVFQEAKFDAKYAVITYKKYLILNTRSHGKKIYEIIVYTALSGHVCTLYIKHYIT